MTPAQKLSGGDFRSYVDPPSPELQKFPAASGEAAERLAKKDNPETDGGCFRRAGEVLGAIAVGTDKPITRVNLQALGVPANELQRIGAVEYIPPESLAAMAERFCAQHSFLLTLIANAIGGFEGGSGGREAVLL